MDAFGYLSFLTSIVLGLGITRVLTGVGQVLQLRGQARLYWVHLVWTLNLFLYLILNWWILFRWSTFTAWSFFTFLFVLLSPTVGFLLAVLLFPDRVEPGLDLRAHFFANHRWFFALAALLMPIDAADTLLKGWDHFVAQGPIYVITLVLLFVLCGVGAGTARPRYHAFFALFFLVYLLTFISINLRMIG